MENADLIGFPFSDSVQLNNVFSELLVPNALGPDKVGQVGLGTTNLQLDIIGRNLYSLDQNPFS